MKKNVIIIVSIFVLVLGAATCVFLSWKNESNTNVFLNIKGLKIKFDGGSIIKDSMLKATDKKEDGIVKKIEVELDNNQTISSTPTLSLYLDLTLFSSELADASFKWEIYRNNETEILANGNFQGKVQGDSIELISNELIQSKKNIYKLYLWIDDNLKNNSNIEEKSFTFTLRTTVEDSIEVYNYELEGIIYHEDGSLCNSCNLTILPENLHARTSETGYYYFEKVPTGKHTLIAEDLNKKIINDKIIIKKSSIQSVEDNTVFLKTNAALLIHASATGTISSLALQNPDTLIVRKKEIFNYKYNTNLDIKKLFNIDLIIINGGTTVCYDKEEKITNINQLNNGNHTIRCISTSKTNATQTSTITINIESKIPSISAKQKNFNLLTSTNISPTEFFNIGEYDKSGGNTTCRVNNKVVKNIKELNNGSYTLTCTMTTSDNKTVFATTILNLDNITPTITAKNVTNNIITSTNLNPSSLFNVGEYSYTGGSVECKINDKTITNINVLENGNYTLKCIATSGSNLSATATTIINLDNLTPVIATKKSINNLTTGTSMSVTEFFNIGEYSYTGGTTECEVDDEIITNINTLTNGSHTLTCTMTTGNNKKTSSTTIINLDDTIPTITAKNDANNIITGTFIEPISLFNVNEFSYTSGTTLCRVGEEEISNLNTLSDGIYNLSCKRTTGAGLSATATTIIKLDNLTPVITAKKSSYNEYLGESKNPTIYFNIGEYSHTGGTTLCKINSDVINNISSLALGTYTLTCNMTTGNDKSTSASINLTISEPPMLTEEIISLSTTKDTQIRKINQKSTAQTSANTEYRFYGATPDNYIYYNCKDTDDLGNTYGTPGYNHASACEIWRVIGVFETETPTDNNNTTFIKENRVKIIREDILPGGNSSDDSSSGFAWDSSAPSLNNGGGVNAWQQADLMTLLNDTYYNKTSSTTCYIDDDNVSIPCNFTTSGLNTMAKNLIEPAKYYLGGNTTYESTSEEHYEAERGEETKVCSSTSNYCNDTIERQINWTGLIGLIYPSDYGYASGSSCDTKDLDEYFFGCQNVNWLYKNNTYQWTITPYLYGSFATYVFEIANNGGARGNFATFSFGVRPSMYLKSQTRVIGGDGTSNNPWKISL